MRRRGFSAKLAVLSVWGLALCGLPWAHADEASMDPAVYRLRERFRSARVPKLEDLAPGQVWNCEYRSAVPGSSEYDFLPNSYRFERQADGTVRSVNDSLSGSYAFASTALVGQKTWGPRVFGEEHLRVGSQGELLVEFTLPECSWLACLFFVVRDASVDNRLEAVVGYSECRVQQ